MNGQDMLTNALETERWTGVNRELLAKMLEEFLYEELLEPIEQRTDEEWTQYRLDYGSVAYRFKAKSRPFDSYRVDVDSIERKEDGEWTAATDAVQFLLDARESLGVAPETASHLVREYNNTLLADAHIDARKEGVEESILDMDYPAIEGEMEGHPWFTINKGRIGFGYDDYQSYAPELKTPQSLVWIAVHRAFADFRSVDGLDYESLLTQQLEDTTAEFADTLRSKGHDPDS